MRQHQCANVPATASRSVIPYHLSDPDHSTLHATQPTLSDAKSPRHSRMLNRVYKNGGTNHQTNKMALPSDAAIFSPSVARLAASTAKDWNYVDVWLASKYRGRSPPHFERNPDTLKALLALANLNEAADESRDLLARVEAGALRDIKAASAAAPERTGGGEGLKDLSGFKSDFLTALEDTLTKDGTVSIEAMAAASVRLGLGLPEPAQLAQALLALQRRASDLALAAARVEVLQRHVDAESARLDALLSEVRGDAYRLPADLARRNVEMQRGVRALAKKLPEMKGQVAVLAKAMSAPEPTVEQVRREEARYLKLLEAKRGLDSQVGEFEGLPPDVEHARQQLDGMRRELRSITDRRDAVFENLVERETPSKGR